MGATHSTPHCLMGADCPPQHTRHQPFCETLVQDTAASMKSGGKMDLDAMQALQKKSCTCFDGFYSESSKLYGQADKCMSDKDWKCNAGKPDEILDNHPECKDWISFGMDFQTKLKTLSEQKDYERFHVFDKALSLIGTATNYDYNRAFSEKMKCLRELELLAYHTRYICMESYEAGSGYQLSDVPSAVSAILEIISQPDWRTRQEDVLRYLNRAKVEADTRLSELWNGTVSPKKMCPDPSRYRPQNFHR